MRKLLTFAASLALGVAVALTSAQASKYYDVATKSWKESGPYRGRSPIKRKTVSYDGPHSKARAGTIVINTKERRLYYLLGNGKAVKYGIGVGRPGFQWTGTHRVSRKAEWPGWTPPPAMRKRVPGLPHHMKGGPNNPLGARALYIGSTIYRIHGSNEPWSIGQAVSSGCIRLANEDVIDLYERAKVGARVHVIQANQK
ncbi:Lipoprotein-anchoring transpeptidase ErfK/SrfK [Cohaesibacter sp. ES.047]|uniref:L,D-transpeptidase n=1 Tax=Cohaesibacter sp. ES.047 TaxID=1798205 RepID=UPI000BB86562|nr:L,D-transpeptidase [Cohaesibacter sp. ES.047]SNY93031.1 Lipoprotein-anchoring transpeptidase ErfK/SrfK [Cohaesibacter sp. ES.047]